MRRITLTLLCTSALGCVSFDEYPEGDLCANAARDEQGRAIQYPEWRVCPPLSGETAGATQQVVLTRSATSSPEPDAGSANDAGISSQSPVGTQPENP